MEGRARSGKARVSGAHAIASLAAAVTAIAGVYLLLSRMIQGSLEELFLPGREYSLFKDEVSLGRGEDNDVVIPHASVSRAHARLMRRNGVFELTDLNSTNGTYLNEQPVHGSVSVGSGHQVRGV